MKKANPLTFGKLLWYDPNPIDNEPINLEDLTISVDLEVTSKTRSVILVNNTSGNATITNNGEFGTKVVNFFKGSEYKSPNSTQDRAITTHYTDIQNLNGTLNDDYEALNIESINIEFNSSYAPMIKIKFVDIRGAAMFSNNGSGNYKFFFELPYPMFKLTIKGYYGKSVQYCLHLLRFNANFNSQTGNFEIDCDFIGFTYALLTDMLMGLVRASVSTERGAAIFQTIKSEYKDPEQIITVDELTDKMSEVNEKIVKIKEGEEGIDISLSQKARTEIENLRNTVLTLLDTYQTGQEKFTKDYKNGILIISKPDSSRNDVLSNAITSYKENVKKKINTDIKNILDFNSGDASIALIKNYLEPDLSGQNGGCGNFVNFILIDTLAVSTIKDEDKLITQLTSGKKYVSGTRLDNIVDLLQNLNYSSQKEVTLIDLSSAIKACDDSIKATQTLNDESVKAATDKLKSEIRGVLGFDPTIRNLFRILCISTETFLQCIYEVSKEAEEDGSGLRAAELNKLGRDGFDVTKGSSKIYPWPEYKVKDAQSDGYHEEWIGNEKSVVVANVPELKFTEELLVEMLKQKRKDKFREEELSEGDAWWPISVIDTPVDSELGPLDTILMTKNPYTVGLVDEISTSSQPLCTSDEALRVLLYRAFLLLDSTNRNNISDTLIKLHGKLEAENLYSALMKLIEVDDATEIKNTITNTTVQSIVDSFSTGTGLNVSGRKKPFFKESGNNLVYTYIVKSPSNRSYIPVNGCFNADDFFTNNIVSDPGVIYNLREDNGALFVSNHNNHTRLLPFKGTFGFSRGTEQDNIQINDGINNSTTRWNYTFQDGAVHVKIISAEKYKNGFLKPSFGTEAASSYNATGTFDYDKIPNCLKETKFTDLYINPLLGNYSANEYFSINLNGASPQEVNDVWNVDSKQGTAPTFLTFFSQPIGDSNSSAYGTTSSEGAIYEWLFGAADSSYDNYDEVAFNGFATNYSEKTRVYGWHEYNETKKTKTKYGEREQIENGNKQGWFRAENELMKRPIFNAYYDSYGKNRRVLGGALKGAEIFVPKIEYAVNTNISYSLFGSKFYYYQNRQDKAFPYKTAFVGNASKALLFLHCFPFQGVNRFGDNAWNKFMFDYKDSDTHLESSTINDSGSSEVLGIKGLFRLHNSFIEAPRIWTLFIGAMLWRMDYMIRKNGDDPVEWFTPEKPKDKDNCLIPNLRKIPRYDEFFCISLTQEDGFRTAGMHFNSKSDDEYPYDYAATTEDGDGSYARIDETLIGLPDQVKLEFIYKFLDFVNGDFKTIQTQLEIPFTTGTIGTIGYLDNGSDSYIQKWTKLNGQYKAYPGTTLEQETLSKQYFNLALPYSGVEELLGNAVNNYVMAAPISEKQVQIWYGVENHPQLDNDELNAYVRYEHAFNLELKPYSEGMNSITNLLTETVYIQNVRPNVWNPPNLVKDGKAASAFETISVNRDSFNTFINSFLTHFKTISNDFERTKQEEEDALQQALFNSLDDDKIKLNIYRTLMSIFQKWVGGLKNTMFTQCGIYNPSDLTIAKHERNIAENPRLIDTFRFLDRSFNDIGDKFYMNPQIFYNMITQNANASFFDVVNKVLSDNNFNFIPLPAFVNFNNVNELADIFEPYPYNEGIVSGPSFVCVYAGQTSTNLDLGEESNYPDDGIFIRIDETNKNAIGLPEDLNNAATLTPYETNLPVFTVNYGQQNQNYFKDVKLDQKEFAETAESLEIIDDISQGGDKMNNVTVGQNLFNVYQKRSYSCEVEMLGCALIQPMMYFQLNNIPMFRGLYLIINVSHSIKPNGMTTTFKGVRVKKTKTPLLSASDVLMTIVGDVSNINTGNSTLGSNASNSSGSISKYRTKLVDYIKSHPITRVIEGSTIDTAKITSAINTALTDWNKGKIEEGANLSVLEKYAKRTAGPSGSEYSDGSQPWSAVFTSYIMSEADSDFPKSAGHINYIAEAINGKNGYEAFPFKNSLKIKPEVGDLACNTDGHCDIIYKVDKEKAYLIGGNLSDTVLNSEDNSYPAPLLIGDGTSDKGGSYYTGTVYDSGDYLLILKKTGNAYFNKAKIGSSDNQVTIAKYLKETSKLNKYQIAGVLGNIHVETAGTFDPNSDNRADGSSVDYGIIHWNSGNWSDADCKLGSSNPNKAIGCIKSKVGDTVDKQLEYLETKQTNFPTFKADSKSSKTAEDTAYLFAKIVEICTGCTGTKAQFLASSAAKKRATYAKTYLDRMNDSEDILYFGNL